MIGAGDRQSVGLVGVVQQHHIAGAVLAATLQVFAEPMTLRPMTNGISSTWSPLMKIYRDAFVQNDIYTASAGSIIVALATFVISFGFLRLIRGQAFAQESR